MSIRRRRELRKEQGQGTKSDHKHDYQDVLLEEHLNISTIHGIKPFVRYCTGGRCRICGKLGPGTGRFPTTERTKEGTYRELSNDELLNRYKDLPIIRIDSIFQRYSSDG